MLLFSEKISKRTISLTKQQKKNKEPSVCIINDEGALLSVQKTLCQLAEKENIAFS